MENMRMIPGYYGVGEDITWLHERGDMITEEMRMIPGYMVEEEHDDGEDKDETWLRGDMMMVKKRMMSGCITGERRKWEWSLGMICRTEEDIAGQWRRWVWYLGVWWRKKVMTEKMRMIPGWITEEEKDDGADEDDTWISIW
jgi:hypothetical protein